jgi:hypothetical protein
MEAMYPEIRQYTLVRWADGTNDLILKLKSCQKPHILLVHTTI